MAKKRPSYVSIRARQRNLIEGIGTRRIKLKQAAKELGVTQQELRTFIETKPTTLRRNFNRSPTYAKLYATGERPETRKAFKVTRIRKFPFRERTLTEPRLQKRPEDKQIGRMIQRLYYENNIGPQKWSVFTYEHNLPNSMKAIKLLYTNGRISPSEYRTILKEWKDDYPGMTASYYASFADEEDELEEEVA